ncbi:MAG: universal stress protein [Sulfitobacter sp.]
MSIQTVTTILTHQSGADTQLDAAISFARACDTHLQVLTMGIGFDHPGIVHGAIDAVPISIGFEEAVARADVLAAHATARLEREDIRWDVDTVASLSSGLRFDIKRHIRFSDLVIQVRPAEAKDDDASKIAQTVLFDADAPLLMLPDAFKITGPAQNIMLAWDESPAALRAARLAMPLLQSATRVHVALIDPSKDAPDRSDPGGAFGQFLARHEVKCEISVMARTETTIAETLAQRAQEMGCDMIVMGAYGHSRLREAIFGGTTKTMLANAQIPVFFAH